jgi:hypothetical protein
VGLARRARDRFALMVVVWLLLGIPVFLIQHWWIYTLAMFLVPVGLLAGYGVDLLADGWGSFGRGTRVVVLVVAAILVVPALVRVSRVGRDVAGHGFALGTGDRAELRADLEPAYARATAWAHRIDAPGSPRGDVYVLGNPLDLFVADRRQSVSINGWSPEQYPEDVWRRVRRELARARPVELVVDRFTDGIMRDRSPQTRRLIASLYEPFGGSGPDTWYRLRRRDGSAPGT